MNIKFYPIFDQKAIVDTWPTLLIGIEKSEKFSLGELSLEAIFNDLLASKLLLWMGYVDEKYIGFLTTRVCQILMGKRYMIIEHIYAKEKIPLDLYLEGQKYLETYAKSMNCEDLRFFTIREKGFERILDKHGYKQAFTMFKKEL